MGLATFKGGVHPYEGKELSEHKPVQILMPKGDLVYPMSQHIGAPAIPLVKKGDKVLAGQKIGEASGFISANVICSVSGTVKAVEPRRVANGAMVNSIVVENDGEYTAVEGLGADRDPAKLSKQEIRDIVKEAGIVGLGGAGFPTHVKLAPKDESKIEYILVNGAECEPYLTSDYRLMMEEPEKLVGGLKVILQLFDNAKGVIGIENNKPEAIKKLQELVKGESRIEVCPLQTKYPQGGERFLISAVTGREINSSMLPADAGCIVHNVDTVTSIYFECIEGFPLTKRIVTVTGDGVKEPQNFYVYLGMNFRQLLDAAGGPVGEPEKYISGGPMMGFAMYSLDVPVVKGSSSLLVLQKDPVKDLKASACIRCGKCGEACPEHLLPAKLAVLASKGRIEEFEKLDGVECVECGSCSFTCPAKRPLAQYIKSMRKQVLANRRKKK